MMALSGRAQLVAHGGEEARLRLARDLRLAVRLLQLDRAPVREVDGLFQQRGHGADAEIAPPLHDREAAGDRLGITKGDQLLHPLDRHRRLHHHRLARHQRGDRPAVIDVEPERLGKLIVQPLALDQSDHPALAFDHREARDLGVAGAQIEHRAAGPALLDGGRGSGKIARQHLVARGAERMGAAAQGDDAEVRATCGKSGLSRSFWDK